MTGTLAMAAIGILVWALLAAWVGSHARNRGSGLWPLHGLGTLCLGIVYAIPYWIATRNG